ncbi:MAG: PqqD family protein [Clostridiales bacterium]|nr:PqqD family protein [Clostridiales bacterium]MCD7803328.1 PqqD family protein [Clostridiales bacterium]MCD7881945.1 PqqD family protein [Clostridiales bacterium]
MKIDSDLVIRNIAGEVVLIPTGKAALNNPGIITLTESGELLVRKLQEGCEFDDLVDCLLVEYEVEREQAEQDVTAFLGKLKERGLL